MYIHTCKYASVIHSRVSQHKRGHRRYTAKMVNPPFSMQHPRELNTSQVGWIGVLHSCDGTRKDIYFVLPHTPLRISNTQTFICYCFHNTPRTLNFKGFRMNCYPLLLPSPAGSWMLSIPLLPTNLGMVDLGPPLLFMYVCTNKSN